MASQLFPPLDPMRPISRDDLPQGMEWGYQLKWDGVRMIALVDNGQVNLYSRQLKHKNTQYPEVVQSLISLKGRFILDGEVVFFDQNKQRPLFQKVLQRERTRNEPAVTAMLGKQPLTYVLFDLLQMEERDLRALPFSERYQMLKALIPASGDALFVTDLFKDGNALWNWVSDNKWEGVVSKRLSSPYLSGKKHADWYKKKTALIIETEIVGLIIRNGQTASLVMELDHNYFGRVSLGLTDEKKQQLLEYSKSRSVSICRYTQLPPELKKERIIWLSEDGIFKCTVTGLEITSDGLLRHPKLVKLSLNHMA